MPYDKDTLLDEIRLGNWNSVKDIVTSLQKEMSPDAFDREFSPIAISAKLVKLMGKAGLHFAKEYADNVWEIHKDSVFTDGVYTLDRNKSGVPFDMEPTSGPYPRGLVPVQKGVGDISNFDKISKVFDSGWISPEGEFIGNEGYAHDDKAKEYGLGSAESAINKGWIRFNQHGNMLYFEGKNTSDHVKRIEQFLEDNPESAGGIVNLDLHGKIYDHIDAEDILKYGLKVMLAREDRSVKVSDLQKKPSWKGWMPPKAPMELYHATAVDNMDSIKSKGLMPFGETTEIRKPAVWMSDKPDFAINHFNNRFPGKKGVLLKLSVDPKVCGLHQSMVGYPNVYVCHETIPANMIIEEIPLTKKSFSLDYINKVANALRRYAQRTGAVLDNLKPLATLWYENEDGDKYILSEEELNNAYFPPDYPYQHFRGPELRDSICTSEGELMSGSTTMNCIGPIVIALVQEKNWNWVDALTFAASTCERCLNILLEETAGDPYPQEQKDSANTWCECCEMIDPDYDYYYKTVVQPDIDRDIEDSVFVGMKDLVASESLMLTPKNTDLAPQADWRYPVRQDPNPEGHRPFMVNDRPHKELKETNEDSHIFFFGPSFNQNLTKVKK